MTTKKTAGRPAIIKTLGGKEVTLPPSITKADAESILPIPASLDEVGGLRWVELWITCKDWVDEKDKYIAEILCMKYQEWQKLLAMREINNIPPIFTHTNKSKTVHPFWKLIADTEKDYLSTLKEMGLTPASFANISKLEKIDGADPLLEAIQSIEKDRKERSDFIRTILEEEEENDSSTSTEG